MKTDPALLHHGETVYLVLECEVTGVTYKPLKDEPDLLNRVHILRADQATIVDAEIVAGPVAEHRDRLERLREQEKGTRRLPLPDELAAAHVDGEHAAGLEPGCPMCAEEIEAVEAESRGKR